MRRNKPKRRRGIVLLVVVGLVTLLVVVGVTFVIVSGNFRRSAQSNAKQVVFGEPPEVLMDRALSQLISDTRDLHSVVRGHSLLRDLYGASQRNVIYTDPVLQANGRFVRLRLLDPTVINVNAPAPNLRTTNNVYAGRVVTFVDGPARGLSTRAVKYEFDFDSMSGEYGYFLTVLTPQSDATNVVPLAGNNLLINGQAFSGTGAGFNSNTGQLDQADTIQDRYGVDIPLQIGGQQVRLPAALLPNLRGVVDARVIPNYNGGRLNESYDAVDYQNMALGAAIPPSGSGTGVINIPSFHRPALVNFWVTWLKNSVLNQTFNVTTAADQNTIILQPFGPDGVLNTPDDSVNPWSNVPPAGREFIAQLMRRVVLRPLPQDHPNFGGNPLFASSLLSSTISNLAWDVDNDGDGRLDSILTDVGLSVVTDDSGRRYKPLVAYKVVDMDNRVNVNAHGHLAQAGLGPVPSPVYLAGGVNSNTAPASQGYGPADVNLAGMLGVADYQKLMIGDGTIVPPQPGRYGWDLLPGYAGQEIPSAVRFFEFPAAAQSNFFQPATGLSAYQSPFDLRGEFAMGLDHRGTLLFERYPGTNVVGDAQYEVDLVRNRGRGLSTTVAADSTFSLGELERVLREDDADAFTLPPRLDRLLYNALHTAPAIHRMVTTDSFDSPTPGFSVGFERGNATLRQNRNQFLNIAELLRIRLAIGLGYGAMPTAAQELALNFNIGQLLSPDLMRGERFDINRPFGNGRDDNNNFVVDDHGIAPALQLEAALNNPETLWNGILGYGTFFDHDNDGQVGTADQDAFLARYHYARHLYVLMMLLKGTTGGGAEIQIDFNQDGMTSQRETALGIAQWCINVVDYRDADTIMTPFEFDASPFTDEDGDGTTWDVDGFLGTDESMTAMPIPSRLVAWGAERPELLITESLAFHDRRTEDRDDVSNRRADSMMGERDGVNDFDQRLLPRGTCMIELFNPWSGDERLPAELYYRYQNPAPGWRQGVVLNQVGPGGSAVWRLAFADDNDLRDPDDENPAQRPTVIRSVYFAPAAAIPGDPSHGEPFTASNQDMAPILPGRYAVIGSAGQTVDHTGNPIDYLPAGNPNGTPEFVSFLGRINGATADGMGGLGYQTTRRIVLEPQADPNQQQVHVFENEQTRARPADINMQPAVAVVVDAPRSFSLSDPTGGYVQANPAVPGPRGETWDPTAQDNEGAFMPPYDEPFDSGDARLLVNGIHENYRVCHLQRLANPLLPWDAVFNPYLTIDSTGVDLSTFNGIEDDDITPTIPLDVPPGPQIDTFYARQRGDAAVANGTLPTDTVSGRLLWQHEPATIGEAPPLTAQPGAQPLAFAPPNLTAGNHVFDTKLRNSLGWLNEGYGAYINAAGDMAVVNAAVAAGATSRPLGTYRGYPDPTAGPTFPWLNWNNRPFVSQFELMQVPTSRSSRLLYNYGINPALLDEYDQANIRGRFTHLMNFLSGSATGVDGQNFFRLFEYTQVPSRFVGTEEVFPSNVFVGAASVPGTDTFRPPFNKVSTHRDPGRINLNTLYESAIGTALLNGHPGPGWAAFVNTRRGYAGGNQTSMDPDFPTLFANAYRTYGAGQLVPLTSVFTPFGLPNNLEVNDISCTLLRPAAGGTVTSPLWQGTPTEQYRNANRNPYFRYESLSRLGNLATNRSHVYAVWMTIAFFEVETVPATSNAHPDGYRLGRELGSDTGAVRRHRAFYMIDRSIPVGYSPGEPLNSDKAVLLKRYIE